MRPLYSMEVYNHLQGEPPRPPRQWLHVGIAALLVSVVVLIALIHQLYH